MSEILRSVCSLAASIFEPRRCRFPGLAICLLTLTQPGLLNAAASLDEIVIVKSSDNAYFDETIATLRQHVDSSIQIRSLKVDGLATDASADDARSLYLALGVSAVRAIRNHHAKAGLISAYLTLEQYQQLNIDGQQAILLDQPLTRYLAFCKLMLDLDSIGVMLPDNTEIDPKLVPIPNHSGFSLNLYRVDPVNKLLPVLRDLLQHNDALLMLPRQSLYNQDSLKGVLLTSYRNRKPAISYSPAHVRSGALTSIYSSPVDIGRHLALIVNHRIEHDQSATDTYEFAKFYSITSNSRVAQALSITLPDEDELRARLDRIRL